MKAIVFERYGPPDVLELREVAHPEPKRNEVLIRIHATTVTSADRRIRSLDMPKGFTLFARLAFGYFRPRRPVLGSEFAGEIERVGESVSRFKAGDQVFGLSGMAMGCHAQYKCMAQDGALALKPPGLGYDEAAALPFGGTTALDFFRRAGIRSGEQVLVNGASGAVGTAAVQLARHIGAEVTGVCSGANEALVRSLGADRVIDYRTEDFTTNGRAYDVIVDTVGTAPFSRCRNSLRPGGRLLLVSATLPEMLRAPWQSMTSGRKIIYGPVAERAADLRTLAELAHAETLRPFIDRHYPFEEIVAAHRYVDTGRKRGSVVITLVP